MPFDIKVKSDPDISSATDSQLFVLMKETEGNPTSAINAWREFYKRYYQYLWKCCLKICRSLSDGKEVAKDIFQSTIQKIYLQAKTFDQARADGVKSWISRIAFNEFIDYYNKYHLHFVSYDEPPDIEDVLEDDDCDDVLIEKVLELQADQLTFLLSKLKPKELKILMVAMSYFQLDNPNSHLPDDEMQRLCIEFDIKSDAIRQIKRRALLKLKKFAKELTLDKPTSS